MLPKRPEMFDAFPTIDTENWCADRGIEWREVGADEFYNYKEEAREIRTRMENKDV
jgi:hypothetical protein